MKEKDRFFMKRKFDWHLAGYVLTGMVLLAVLGGCGKAGGKADINARPSEQEDQTISRAEADAENEEETAESKEEGVVFEGQDVEGNTFSSDVFAESKITMINVWATYCNPCLSEMPGLGELAEEYEPADFQIIGIISDVQEGADDRALEYVSELIEQTGADYPHLLLNESLYRGLLTEVSAVPTTFFLNEKGEILDVVIGAMKKSAWEEKINTLLGK